MNMPVLARTLEKEKLSTILVTNMPYWVEKTGVPRTLAVEFPFGHLLGQPNNKDQQFAVILQALKVLEIARQPGIIMHSDENWPFTQEEAMKDWQPIEPSPIVANLAKNFKKSIRDSRMNK